MRGVHLAPAGRRSLLVFRAVHCELLQVKNLVNNEVITWLPLRIAFVILLPLAIQFTDGERFSGFALTTTISFSLLGLLARAPACDSEELFLGSGHPRGHVHDTRGGALCPPVLHRQCVSQTVGRSSRASPHGVHPRTLRLVFGPVVGFFIGAVAHLLGDFVTGWGVFPAWRSAAD